jgi:hypothetical protein
MPSKQKGKRISCKGFTTKIDPCLEADISCDHEGRFYTINHKLADIIISQNPAKIPIFIQHLPNYQIGHVSRFYKEKLKDDDILVADFEITSQAFLNALSKQAAVRYVELQHHPFTSPDHFVTEESVPNNDSLEPITLDAQLALTQKFAGLSLSHDPETLSVTELSICLAGARDLSVITEVSYSSEDDIVDCDKNTEQDYLTLFSSALSYANFLATHKVAKDLEKIGGDPKKVECLVYSQMHKLPQAKDKNMNEPIDKDTLYQDLKKDLLQDIKEGLKKSQPIDKDNNSKYNSDLEEMIRMYQKQKRHEYENNNDREYFYDIPSHNRYKRLKRSYEHEDQHLFDNIYSDMLHYISKKVKRECEIPPWNNTCYNNHHCQQPEKIPTAKQLPHKQPEPNYSVSNLEKKTTVDQATNDMMHIHYIKMMNKVLDRDLAILQKYDEPQQYTILPKSKHPETKADTQRQSVTIAKDVVSSQVQQKKKTEDSLEMNKHDEMEVAPNAKEDTLVENPIKMDGTIPEHKYSLRSGQQKPPTIIDLLKNAESALKIE